MSELKECMLLYRDVVWLFIFSSNNKLGKNARPSVDCVVLAICYTHCHLTYLTSGTKFGWLPENIQDPGNTSWDENLYFKTTFNNVYRIFPYKLWGTHPWGSRSLALILSARRFLQVLQFRVGAPPSHTPLLQNTSLPSLSMRGMHFCHVPYQKW